MSRRARLVLIALGAVALLIVLLPLLVPLSVYRDQVEAELTAAIGRPVRIEGPMKLTLFPDLGIRAEQVIVTNLPGGHAPYLARAEDVRVAASLKALFTGRIQVTQVVVERPDFRFEVDSRGRPNWNVAPAQGRHSGLLNQMKTSVAEVKLTAGTLRYEDARTNTREDIQNLDATLDWFGKTLAIEGELTDNGEQIAFVAKTADPTALVNARPSHVDLSLTSDLVQASFKGTLTLNGPASGYLKFDTPSLRRLAAWRGRGLPNVGGLGPLSVQARLVRGNEAYALSDLKLVLDGTSATGTLIVDNSQTVSILKGMLSLDRLVADPYMLVPGTRPWRGPGWDPGPIDLSLLNLFDADLKLNIASLRMRSLVINDVMLPVVLKAGVLDTRFEKFDLYGGTGTMEWRIDASGAVPAFRARLSLNRFAARPFLSAVLGVGGLDGTGRLDLDVAARGASVASIMKSLWGHGNVNLANGVLRGADLELAGRAAHMGAPEAALAPKAAMHFGTLRGSFTLANGDLRNEDFGLSNPIVEILGGGSVDLGARRMSFVFRPRARLEHDERPMNTISDFSAPFRLLGSWDSLKMVPGAGSP